MEAIPPIIFYACISLIVLYALYVLLRTLPYIVYDLFDAIGTAVRNFTNDIADGFDLARDEAEKRKRRANIIEEIQNRVHAKKSSKVDPRVVQFHQESAWIREGFKAYQEHVALCVEIRHLYKETFPDVDHMSQFEGEPEIRLTQERSVDFADTLLDWLNASRMTARSSELLKLRLGLTVMRRVCENCELLQYPTKSLPRLCSVAKWVGSKPACGPTDNDHDSQHE